MRYQISLMLLSLLLIVTFLFKAQSQHTGHQTQNKLHEDARVSIEVPPEQQKKIGLKVATAEKRPIKHTIRTVGLVTADQTKEAHVHSRINGWIEKIFADYVGGTVKKGQALFELYGPELVSTQEEYLAAHAQGRAGKEIATAAIDRLNLWGVPPNEIENLKKTQKVKRTIIFNSPIDGNIIRKNAISGMYITPELELYHLADLSEVWVIATLYEYDLAVVSVGDQVNVQLPYDKNKNYPGKISYIFPEIDVQTRTAKARIVIANPNLALKPGMYANIEIKKDLGEAIVIRDDAIIDTGLRTIVFIKKSETRFEPREVKIGPRVGNEFIVIAGLKEGEIFVDSAHFLIDSESKLKATSEKRMPAGHGGHGE